MGGKSLQPWTTDRADGIAHTRGKLEGGGYLYGPPIFEGTVGAPSLEWTRHKGLVNRPKYVKLAMPKSKEEIMLGAIIYSATKACTVINRIWTSVSRNFYNFIT